MINNILSVYPYLGLCAGMALVYAFVLLLFRKMWKISLLSGLLATPFALTSWGCVPEYWNPHRLINIMRTGIEDVIISFVLGALAALMGFSLFRRRIVFRNSMGAAIIRYLSISVVGVAIGMPFYFLGVRPSTTGFISTSCALVLLLYLRPDLWPCALCAGMGYCMVYIPVLSAAYYFWPHFALQWNHANLWGEWFGHIPIDEFIWALTTAAASCSFMAYVLGLEWQEAGAIRVSAPQPDAT
ncbi:MAG: lycopene cyclase domain-containing protein [Candidatus Sumerlaeota bacterium]|nr:lycopene cyclase domain-containing protein [Candidatus Sumerlaeota bacterium]